MNINTGIKIKDLPVTELLNLTIDTMTDEQLLEFTKALQVQRTSAPTRRATVKREARIVTAKPLDSFLTQFLNNDSK